VVLGLVALVVIALALAAVCINLGGRLRRTRHELAAERGEVQALTERLGHTTDELAAVKRRADVLDGRVTELTVERDALTDERDTLRHDHDQLAAAHGRLDAEHERLTAEHAATNAALARERSRAEAAEAAQVAAEKRTAELLALVEERTDEQGKRRGKRGRTPEPGAAWRILLATLERRWAGVVGALPDDRGVAADTVPEQLTEALGRESERMREEIGVDVEVTAITPIDPADPVTFLLATTDLLGVLASTCERVTLTLDGSLQLTGEGWAGPTDDLELARARAVAAGTEVDVPAVDDEQVTLTLHP
jgi:hypothetical protein